MGNQKSAEAGYMEHYDLSYYHSEVDTPPSYSDAGSCPKQPSKPQKRSEAYRAKRKAWRVSKRREKAMKRQEQD
jgi:hypothetical protein